MPKSCSVHITAGVLMRLANALLSHRVATSATLARQPQNINAQSSKVRCCWICMQDKLNELRSLVYVQDMLNSLHSFVLCSCSGKSLHAYVYQLLDSCSWRLQLHAFTRLNVVLSYGLAWSSNQMQASQGWVRMSLQKQLWVQQGHAIVVVSSNTILLLLMFLAFPWAS